MPQMKQTVSMCAFFAALEPRSSEKVSMMIPKTTLSSTISTTMKKERWYDQMCR